MYQQLKDYAIRVDKLRFEGRIVPNEMSYELEVVIALQFLGHNNEYIINDLRPLNWFVSTRDPEKVYTILSQMWGLGWIETTFDDDSIHKYQGDSAIMEVDPDDFWGRSRVIVVERYKDDLKRFVEEFYLLNKQFRNLSYNGYAVIDGMGLQHQNHVLDLAKTACEIESKIFGDYVRFSQIRREDWGNGVIFDMCLQEHVQDEWCMLVAGLRGKGTISASDFNRALATCQSVLYSYRNKTNLVQRVLLVYTSLDNSEINVLSSGDYRHFFGRSVVTLIRTAHALAERVQGQEESYAKFLPHQFDESIIRNGDYYHELALYFLEQKKSKL